MNKDEEALKFYDQAIERDSKDSRYYINKGELLLKNQLTLKVQKQNKLEQAVEQYDYAIKYNPENSKYFFYKGIHSQLCYLSEYSIEQIIIKSEISKMNRQEEALTFYDLAIKLNPQDSENYVGKANTLLNGRNLKVFINDMNKFEEALKQYDYAINIHPNDSRYYGNKANTLLN